MKLLPNVAVVIVAILASTTLGRCQDDSGPPSNAENDDVPPSVENSDFDPNSAQPDDENTAAEDSSPGASPVVAAKAQAAPAIDSSITMTSFRSMSDSGVLMKSTDPMSAYSSVPIDPTDYWTMFIHGWVSGPTKDKPMAVKNAELSTPDKKVVLMMNWSNTANTLFYDSLVSKFDTICYTMKTMVVNLVQARKLDLAKFICVGHSYGAHLCSACLARYFSTQSTPVKEVRGLDMAKPGFDNGNPNCLKNTDAPITTCIYTSKDAGMAKSLCTNNYFINHAGPQPWCNGGSLDCNHVAAMLVYANELSKGHPNYKYQLCNSDSDALAAGSTNCGTMQAMASMINGQASYSSGIRTYNVNATST